jgi:hypothetical protein
MTAETFQFRAGRYIKQLEGYSAFIPEPLPPSPPIHMNAELMRLLSDADRAPGRLSSWRRVGPS